MKGLLTMILLALLCVPGISQEMRVTGKVTDARTGAPLEGVSIGIKGRKAGTATLPDGSFAINAAGGDVIVISSVGYITREVAAAPAIAIAIEPANEDLTDVVVVGYGTQRRTNVTGSIVNLKNETLTRRQIASTSSLLQGLAPGLTVQQQSGKPGADGSSLRIRGNSSIYAGGSPLIMVDGVVSSMEQIDPNAIESITVLKDAASTAIYGARAANGVILVKTKRADGSKDLKVSYNNFVSKQVATAIPRRVSAVDHMELSNLAQQNLTGNPNNILYPQSLIDRYKNEPANNLDIIDTDWIDLLFTNNGMMHNHNVQLRGGGERVGIFASMTYLNQQGLIPNSSFEKYDLRFNPDFKLSDKLTLSGVFAYNSNSSVNPSTGSAEFIIRQAIGLPAIGAGKFGPGMYGNAGQTNNRNPLAMAEAAGTTDFINNTLLSKVQINYTPVRNLEIEAYWAREHWVPNSKTFVKNVDIYVPDVPSQTYTKVGVWPGNTRLGETYSTNVRKTYLAQATYSLRLGEHSFKWLAGGQTEEFRFRNLGASRTGFLNPDLPYLNLGQGDRDNSGSAYETALAGAYGRFNYSYADKYLLELNGRYDGSSRFSQEFRKQWGFFPSASAGWIISREKFFDGLSRNITFAKLRGSIGTLGNQALPDIYPFVANYQASTYSNPNNGTSAYFNNVTTLGLALLTAANPSITWEKSKQWNVGLDLGIGRSWNISADYFVRGLSDMLLRQTLPGYVGLGSPFVNAGTMENRGWELMVNYKKKVGKLGVDITGMVSDVQNKVTSLAGLPFIDGGSIRTAEGFALFSYFGHQSLGYFKDSNDIKTSPVQFGTPWDPRPNVGPKPGDVKYADISGPEGKPDGKVDNFDRTFIGNNFPRYEYSINMNFSLGQFDLNLFGQGVGRRDNYLSGTGAVPFASGDFAASLLDHHKDYWRPDNQNALFPRLLPAGSGGNNYVASTHWIRSARYFRIKNVQLGYSLPTAAVKRLKIQSARVFVSGNNLLTFTPSWRGFDPEINAQNAEFYPLMRTYTAGVNVNF